jgi:RHS repeat-associated protein
VEHDGSPSGPNFTPAVDVGFTGHQHDDDLGLINMRGRIYDPALRRFLTPDPLVAFPLFGQSFNRYAYALNSPLSFTDPTGFNPNKASGGWFYEGGPPVKLSVPRGLDGTARAVPKAPPKTAPRPPSATTSPSNSHSDGAEFKEPTGAAAAQSKATSSTPAPQVEAPSAPAVSAPAPMAAGGAAADVPVGPPPPESTGDPDGEPGSWRDSTVVQGAGGFLIGLGLGLVPFGGVVETGLSATGVIDEGTRAARIGLAVGEVIGGAFLTAIGAGGSAASIALSATGLGAVAGVPALVGSAGLLTAGAGNVGAGLGGLWQALSTGGGGGPTEMHHTIPREIRAPRSGEKSKWLPDDVANHPDVVGRPGLPNRWAIPKELHRSMHPRYNERFKEELSKLEGKVTVKDVLDIRDRLAKEFKIDGYRP